MTSVLYDVPGPRARRRALIGTVIGGLVLLGLVAAIVARLAAKNQFQSDMWTIFLDPGVQRGVLRGLLNTVKAAVVAIAFALVLGAILAAGRLSEHAWLRIPAVIVIEFFRAIPLLLLIVFGFFAYGPQMSFLGEALDAEPPAAFAALVIGLVLYNGSVLAEVFRAGVNAVPRGQSEAGYAIGMRKTQLMTIILMPQAVRIMLPVIVAQCVVALKDSALGFIIAYEELLNAAKSLYRSPEDLGLTRSPFIQTIVVVGTIYVLLNLLLGAFARWVERRMSRSEKVAGPVLHADAVGAPGADGGDSAR